MSMYADYLRERTTDEIVETDKGFATYRYLPEDRAVYIVDLYVAPEHRKQGVASTIADEIVKCAKLIGYAKLIGSVMPSAKGSTASMDVLRAYGMKLKSSGVDFIIFEKEI